MLDRDRHLESQLMVVRSLQDQSESGCKDGAAPMSTVQFLHALDRHGKLIGIDAADKERDSPFSSLQCNRKLVVRNVMLITNRGI
jgi:hypothetical protein